MIGESPRAEESASAADLYPGAAELFRQRDGLDRVDTVRWVAGLVAVGVVVLVGRAVVDWMNRNL
ncbi:MAG TPA: hypothetical protein VI007_09200 [bacterium]